MSYKTGLLLVCIALVVVAVSFAVPLDDGEEEQDLGHWVVSVPQGLARAKRLSEEHDLIFLGEVIPETNLFHFSVKEHHRKKRSVVENVHQSLTEHSDIEEVHPQTVVLNRVKRRPIDDDDDVQFLSIQKRQVSGPRSSGSPGEGKEVCFISTKESEDKPSKRCIFPFSFKGKSYIECTTDGSTNKAEWCATEVNRDGSVITGQWGDCDRDAISCFVVGTSPENRLQPGRPFPAGSRPPPPPSPSREIEFRPEGQFQSEGQSRPGNGFRPEGPLRSEQSGQSFGPPQSGFFPPGGFLPNGAGFFRPGDLPPLNRLPVGPHRQQPVGPGGFPPQLPYSFPPGFSIPPQDGPKKGAFPPETTDPALVEKSDELMTHFNDKAWPYMWFLNRGGRGSHGLDMNVDEAWAEGLSGKGIVVSILDDGIEVNHPDLKDNYDKEASTDLNDNDEDPSPRYDIFNSNKHGTRCAGTVAAVANNSLCAVGIAYNSKVGGIRILDGNILDALEAKALSFNRDHIDIYSASWGPDDNGQTVDGPGMLASRALRDGVEKGRGGKGSLFVWASGNGGKFNDNCNCDGYTTSIYTLSVSSTSEEGTRPWYSEACSSSLATTFSSGSKSKQTTERKVVTTDLHGECTDQHTGTSASSPMAAGIIALALEANKDLTWRDLQHLVIRTARPEGLLKAEDWRANAAGLKFSHSYGFGLMDAGKLVKLAKNWKSVPEHVNCTTKEETPSEESSVIQPGEEIYLLDASECSNIKFLEHIQLHIDLTSQSYRGDLSVHLLSPAGTESILLAVRPHDKIRTGLSLFSKWPMMSVHYWGEEVASNGSVWKLLIQNSGDRPAILKNWSLTFYGTTEDPQPGVPIVSKQPDEISVEQPRLVEPEDAKTETVTEKPEDEMAEITLKKVDSEEQETVQPEVTTLKKVDSEEPETAQPEVVTPKKVDAEKPETVQPEVTTSKKVDTEKQETAQPEVTEKVEEVPEESDEETINDEEAQESQAVSR